MCGLCPHAARREHDKLYFERCTILISFRFDLYYILYGIYKRSLLQPLPLITPKDRTSFFEPVSTYEYTDFLKKNFSEKL